ncbi:hypothetical protein C2S52_008124 [Perilla frutescens var. hirtella]|nr:hypothetical protein C2S52_008124 [Perilla frutescens var. hirtella]
MVTTQTLLLTCSSLLIVLLHLSQTTRAIPQTSRRGCSPSACGVIHNISYPFRLKHDPKRCGYPKLELACENNVTSIYLNSQKYYVKAINYHNSTIRLVDASIISNDTCSFPKSSAYAYNFTSRAFFDELILFHPYSTYLLYDDREASPINLMRCPTPLKNSSLFTDITHDCASNSSTHTGYSTYVKVGHMNASEVPQTCELEVIVMTSWKKFKGLNSNVSLSEIHDSLLYGFELDYGWSQTTMLGLLVSFLLMILGIFIGGNILARVIILCPLVVWVLIYKFRRRHLSIFDTVECFLRSDNKLTPIRYSYSDIKKMTRGFQEKLGEGGYGYVYKGTLRSGQDVAVKLLGKSGTNDRDFMNEIATIGTIHHVNIVKLVGYCAQGSKRALVYDFMPNGSLEKYIFHKEKMNSLNWNNKFDIAVGVAQGIKYLHQGCDVQILHFDIKPHNILLDDKFIPKISDFGLAKIFSTEKNTVTLTAVRGTIGYVAPELVNRGIGRVSYKADVYSFGMLLLEMVNLKRVKIENNDDLSQYFPYWIYDCFNQGKSINIGKSDEVDDNDDSDSTSKLARKMAIVALWCILWNPEDRPSMNKVLEMLEGDIECLQVPDYPSESTHNVVHDMDQFEITCSTDSTSLPHHDDALPSVEIIVQD